MKKITKYFNSTVEKTLIKVRNKTNKFFVNNFRINNFNIIKYFNFTVKKTLIKVRNKTNKFFFNNTRVSNFNKILIIFISLLFIYLFYLLIPTTYNKTWTQNTIESKLLEDFSINFDISSDISYNILPAPHFLIKNSKIFKGNAENLVKLSEIKKLKVFINKNNFFKKKEKMTISEVFIEDANFVLKGSDFKYLNKTFNKKFSKKKIKVDKSKIFLKDNSNETISIIKLSKASLFHDNLKIVNSLNLRGEVFNIPFTFNIYKNMLFPRDKEVSLVVKSLKLNIFNESFEKPGQQSNGLNIISILNSKIQTKYNIKKNLILFSSDSSRIKDTNIDYDGSLFLKPFDLKLDVNMQKYKISKFFDTSSIFVEFIKTNLLFNENISAGISVNADHNVRDAIFNSARIKFNIVNGNINLDQTKFINSRIGSLKLSNSNLSLDNNKFMLSTDVSIDIKNSDNLYSYLQTPKKLRNPIKNIFANLEYDLLRNEINLKIFKINSFEVADEVTEIIENFEYDKDNNLNKMRRMLNKAISAYDG
jgi:hypothetical protein